MREEVIELGKLGPLPSSVVALRDNLSDLIIQYERLIISRRRLRDGVDFVGAD